MDPINRLGQVHGVFTGRMAMLGFNDKRTSILTALTDELINSSEIEGIKLNPESVRSSLARHLGIEDDGILIEDHYIEGLVEVMLDALKNCREKLTAERIFGWHAALFPTGRSGMHKITVGDWRVGDEPMQVVSGAMGHEKVHYQAPPSEAVPKEMETLIKWCNREDLSPYLMAALAHLWFVTIHPFDDGNGRISRTLSDMILARVDEGQTRYYSMSGEINRHKKEYYDILEKTQKGNLDITEWILWFFNCLEEAIERSTGILDRVVQKSVFWEQYRRVELNMRQHKIINRLWDHFDGKLTTSKWAKMCKCSQDTALRDINDLIEKGILCAGNEGGRSTHYKLKYDL